jgi:hypothetical protein
MASATKPKPVTTPAPQLDDATAREAAADRQHVLEIIAAVDEADVAVGQHVANGLPLTMPTEMVRLAIANVFIATAARPEQSWPKPTWFLLERLLLVANKLNLLGTDCLRRSMPWPVEILDRLWRGVAEGAEYARCPPPAAEPFERQLETLGELQDQKVSTRQIARMYDWSTPQGEPDTARVRQAIAEKGPTWGPTVMVQPPRDPREPLARPAVGTLYDLGQLFSMYLADNLASPMPTDSTV